MDKFKEGHATMAKFLYEMQLKLPLYLQHGQYHTEPPTGDVGMF
jgi:hypothetical protein